MRIAVICGSLAKGKDGVGDYSRRLVSAIGSGHQILLLSLRDIEKKQEQLGNVQVQRFRNPLYRADAASRALGTIREFQPDVISLQFVPFAFSSKGVIRELISLIDELADLCPIHIMFHELWLGEKPSLPLKHKILGIAQKRLILRALGHWKPALIHTSNTHYRDVLLRNGHKATILPLFGNIPIEAADPAAAESMLTHLPVSAHERIILFPFSQSHSWHSRHVMSVLKKAAQIAGVSLRLIQVGKNAYVEHHWPRIKAFARHEGWKSYTLGPRTESELSQLLQLADVGVSSAHLQLAGKSGAIIGMLEHGLPVICSSMELESRYNVPPMDSLSALYSIDQPVEDIAELLANPVKAKSGSRLSAVATQWIDELGALA
ncbi:MAG: hypothetical protein AAGC73_02790 [Verrucomicrobiota bacterium]